MTKTKTVSAKTALEHVQAIEESLAGVKLTDVKEMAMRTQLIKEIKGQLKIDRADHISTATLKQVLVLLMSNGGNG